MLGYDLNHQLALFVGDLPVELAQRIPRLVKASADERDQLARDGLAELRAHNLLTDSEVAQLSTILRSLRDVKVPPDRQADLADTVLQKLTAADAGPVALAIANVASKSSRAIARFSEEHSRSGVVTREIGDFSTWQECACAGGIVGATAGIIGGPAGVLAGAAAGAAGGAIGFGIAQALM